MRQLNPLEKSLKRNPWATSFIDRWQYDAGKILQFYDLNRYLSRNREKAYDFEVLCTMLGIDANNERRQDWKRKFDVNMEFLESEETKGHSYVIWLTVLGLWSIFESCLFELADAFIEHKKFEIGKYKLDFPKANLPSNFSKAKDHFKKIIRRPPPNGLVPFVERYEFWLKYLGLSSKIEPKILKSVAIVYAVRNNFAHNASMVDKKVKSEIRKYYKGKFKFKAKLELDSWDLNSIFEDLADYISLMHTRVIRYFYAETELIEFNKEFLKHRKTMLSKTSIVLIKKDISRINRFIRLIKRRAGDKKERFYLHYTTIQISKHMELVTELKNKLEMIPSKPKAKLRLI